MPFKKLDENLKKWPDPCRSKNHNPPGHIVLKESCIWVCPDCGAEQLVIVNRPRLSAADLGLELIPHIKAAHG